MSNVDIRCPIMCGDCCSATGIDIDGIRYVAANRTRNVCPHKGPDGCLLERNRRPPVCNSHLCDKAQKAIAEAKEAQQRG